MADKRQLPQVDAEPQGLGLPTIMDRALAAEHGVRYVHLAVFCIDLDRMHQDHLEDERLEFGWEVFLTECFVCGHLDPAQADTEVMLREMCTVIMEAEAGHGVLGSQLAFAVYAAASRGALARSLLKNFRRWKGLPTQLASSLDALRAGQAATLPRLAALAGTLEIKPAPAPPTLDALEKMATGVWTLY